MNHPTTNDTVEYLKLAGILGAITALAIGFSPGPSGVQWLDAMRRFMGLFFLVFGLAKLFDLRTFVQAYAGYDVIAKRWTGYGYIYPFIELALAVIFLFQLDSPPIYWLTAALMAIGSVGVARELSRHSKVRCACLGSFVQLPLTTVSLVEDVTMVVMAIVALVVK